QTLAGLDSQIERLESPQRSVFLCNAPQFEGRHPGFLTKRLAVKQRNRVAGARVCPEANSPSKPRESDVIQAARGPLAPGSAEWGSKVGWSRGSRLQGFGKVFEERAGPVTEVRVCESQEPPPRKEIAL